MPAQVSDAQTALVFGANGISGVAAIETLLSKPATEVQKVIAVSRREPVLDHEDDRLTFLSIDVIAKSVNEIIKMLKDAGGENITHVYYYAYIAKDKEEEAEEINTEMLKKSLMAVQGVAKNIDVVLLQTGYKYYGVHKGGKYLAPMPFKEDANRHPGPNFYYPEEDLLQQFAQENGWKYLVTRPNHIIGVTKGNFMNFGVTIALYAMIQKELGKPFIFPGNKIMYNNIVDHSAAMNNAAFQVWLSTHVGQGKVEGNRAFNIHDGNKIRWKDVWPKIARYFGLTVPSEDEMFTKPTPKEGEIGGEISLPEYMKDKDEVWNKMVKKYGLDPKAFEYATWEFGDFITHRTWPDDADMSRAREAGWTTTVDSYQMWANAFDKMKKLKIIPAS
ncbi:hypothetical protein HDU85_006020 [Gaertneriomyces sp. JEL0708]|nr:hypothetical protein HDU85_006020 [Gaertneriomyces sp. JEL0708]